MGETGPRRRIALLSYRGDPHCGGQGVYVRNLSRELVRLGHHVEVIAGTPTPTVDDGVVLTHLPSLDLYSEPDPFRVPRPWELRDRIDIMEFATMCAAGFPEPRTFSLRAARHLRKRRQDFDVVHDNQCLGVGLDQIRADGFPLVATIHHPIHRDRDLELAAVTGLRRFTLRRWYAFARMQARVARRVPDVITVSESSAADIEQDMGIPHERLHRVPVGFDPAVFHPRPDLVRHPHRIVTTASADVPLKGLTHLLEAVAKLRTEREVELVVVGRLRPDGPTDRLLGDLGLRHAVQFVSGLEDQALAELLATAAVVAVPSLYEGFCLPAIEAMASRTPVVATTGGALPEVVGDGGLLVPPGDGPALAGAIRRLLDDDALRDHLGASGHDRVRRRFTWRAVARQTAQVYEAAIDRQAGAAVGGVPC